MDIKNDKSGKGSFRGCRAAVVPLVFMSVFSLDAFAQLEEVIVTAQKRAQSADDVGMSIQAISGSALKDNGVVDASDLTQLISGFTFSRSNANTPIFTLRGIGFQTPNLSSSSPVGVYLDEVALAYPYMANGPLFDIERVEVLKGPQGTLYGRNTTGGLVNFIAAKPTQDFESSVTMEAGNYDTYNFEGFVNGAISDTVSVRLAARSENSDEGWQKSRSRNDELGEKERAAARLSVLWEPNDRLTANFGASWWQDKSDTVATQASAFIPDEPAFINPGIPASVYSDWDNDEADWGASAPGRPEYRTDSRFYSLTARFDYQLTDSTTLVSLTSYNDLERRDFTDADGTSLEVIDFDSMGEIQSFSQEFRIHGETDNTKWLVGAFYAEDEIVDNQVGYYDEGSTVEFLRFVGLTIPQTEFTPEEISNGFARFGNKSDHDIRSYSILGNVEWMLNEQVTILAGLRYTKDRTEFAGCSTDHEGNTRPVWNTTLDLVASGVGGSANVGVNECLTFNESLTDNVLVQNTLEEENVSGRIGINYMPNEDMLIYASLAQGYKTGAFPVVPGNSEVQFEPAVQEKLVAYEVGVKSSLFDRAAQLNASVFFYDYTDKQLYGNVIDPVFTTLELVVNVPESEVYGGEIELTVSPTDSLRFGLNASYTHSEITDFIGINSLGEAEDFAGSDFPYTPEWQVNGQISYLLPVGSEFNLISNLSAHYQTFSEGVIGGEHDFRIGSYTTVNATMNLVKNDDSFQVGLYARNLFDENYWTNADTLQDTIFRVPGMPRTYGVSVSYNFD